MQVTTKASDACSHCEGTLELHEQEQYITPRGGLPYRYFLEFSECDTCGYLVVKSKSIFKNDTRKKQAQLEATVAYKMKKWILNKKNLQ